MGNALRRLAGAYRMELRLLCLHWSYPVLHLLWVGLLIYMMQGLTFLTAGMALEHDLGSVAMSLLPLIAMFVAGASASRSLRLRFAAIEDVLPIGAEIWVGRWLAVLTGLAGALLAPLGIAASIGPGHSFVTYAPSFALECFLGMAFAASIGWWVTIALGGRRLVYPLMALLWFALMAAPSLLSGLTPGFQLFRFMERVPGPVSEVWGRLALGSLPRWFSVTYAGAVLMMMGLAAWRLQVGRTRRRQGTVLAVGLAGLAITLVGGGGYFSVLGGWAATARADEAHHLATVGKVKPAGEQAEFIEAYDLTADLSDPSSPRFTASLTVRNRLDRPVSELTFTLNRRFQVTGENLSRDADYVTVKLPQPLPSGEATGVKIEYGGPLWMIKGSGTFPSVASFTAPGGVRLVPGSGWYPLGGRVWYGDFAVVSPPFTRGSENLTHPPASFRLKVAAPPGFGVTSNLPRSGPSEFGARAATWAMLMASPELASSQLGKVLVTSARTELPRVMPLAPRFEKAAEFLLRYFPGQQVAGIHLMALDTGDGVPESTPPADGYLVVSHSWRSVIGNTGDRYRGYFEVGRPLVRDLWAQAGGDVNWLVVEGVGRYLWQVYTKDDPGEVPSLMTLWGGKEAEIAKALAQVHAEQGEAGLITTLERLRKTEAELIQVPGAKVADWVKGAYRP